MSTALGVTLLIVLIAISAVITIYFIISEKENTPSDDDGAGAVKDTKPDGTPPMYSGPAPKGSGLGTTAGEAVSPPTPAEKPAASGRSLYSFVLSKTVRVCAWCQAENADGAMQCEVCGMSLIQEDV